MSCCLYRINKFSYVYYLYSTSRLSHNFCLLFYTFLIKTISILKYIYTEYFHTGRTLHISATLMWCFGRRGVRCSSCSFPFYLSPPRSVSSPSPYSPRSRFSKGPVTSRLLGRSKYLNLTPRSLGREKGTCSFRTGRFVITLPYASPTGPARVDVIKTNDLKTQLPLLRLLKCLSVKNNNTEVVFCRAHTAYVSWKNTTLSLSLGANPNIKSACQIDCFDPIAAWLSSSLPLLFL